MSKELREIELDIIGYAESVKFLDMKLLAMKHIYGNDHKYVYDLESELAATRLSLSLARRDRRMKKEVLA